MNALPILLFSLVAVVTSHVLPKTRIDHCQTAGPEVYCASKQLTSDCKAEAFCEEYLRRSPCDKGPEVYCKTKRMAYICNKVAFCLTWPNDEVVAVKIVTEDPLASRYLHRSR